MFLFGKNKASPSLRALRQKVAVETLAHVQPILLLRILIGLSQSLNGGIAQPEALARALLLDGRQRLRRLLDAAPRLNLPLEDVLEILHSDDGDDEERTAEESAVQALFEMCLGLILQWLAEKNTLSQAPAFSGNVQRIDTFFSPSLHFLLLRPPRTRACPTSLLV